MQSSYTIVRTFFFIQMKRIIITALCLGCLGNALAQKFEVADAAKGTVKTNTFWSDCFLQVGLDMTLQNPYGYKFSDVFPNGKSFGVDVALGKWFSPQAGVRGKLNWENGIGLFRNDQANWLAPFYHPGENMDKGGYISVYGDVLLNVPNIIGTYRPDRAWDLSVYPRIGVNYNYGVSKGSLQVGAGLLNTYRLNDRWSLYCDLAYIMTGSGFVGSENTVATGTGTGHNGYLAIDIGAQMTFGTSHRDHRSVATNGFWHNWFVQAGVDMSLMKPYGYDFSEVFPKGVTFGLNAAVGKWFTPEFGLRGRLYWENGLIENTKLEWVPPVAHPEENYKGHGFGTATVDALINLTNAIAGYDADKKWHTSVFVRAGIISQFQIGSASPVGGAGLQETYRLNDRLSLFTELAYQVTTSESSAGLTGMGVGSGSNGFFDVDLGVVIDLGKRTWSK